jgi:hypothetical protein
MMKAAFMFGKLAVSNSKNGKDTSDLEAKEDGTQK